MKLTLDQLNACVDGVLDVVEEDGGYFPRRFTREQRDAQYGPESGFYLRTFVLPGCKLDFTTDAAEMSFCLTRGTCKTSISSYAADLWQNGVLTHHFEKPLEGLADSPAGKILPDFEETVSLLPGTKRVELYLPRNVRLLIKAVSLSDGASFEPTVHRRRMLVFGDSITAACNALYPSLAYISLLSRHFDARTYNYAVGGEAYKAKCIVPGTYPEADLILVAYGTNGRKDPDKWKEGTLAFFEALNREFPGKPAYVILPIHRMGEETETDRLPLPEVRRLIRETCAKYPQITVLNGETYVPWDEAMYQDKVLHPNDAGMAHYAMNLIADLEKHLK